MSNALPALDQTSPRIDRRTSILTGLAAAALAASASAADSKENPDLEKVRALLKSHDEAMKSHDLPGILALMTEKAAIMGTGPGEIWSGHEEIRTAYEHFFQDFDKGQQEFEYQFKIGDLGAGMGWLMASGNIKAKKDGKALEFPINISLTVTKQGSKWLIASMHYSTLTGGAGAQK
jgi:uncharacterized protein (TIGR02246 family)